MTHLLLIRHSVNSLQGEGILVGCMPDVYLNQKGRAQAEALAHRLASVEMAAVYTSPPEKEKRNETA